MWVRSLRSRCLYSSGDNLQSERSELDIEGGLKSINPTREHGLEGCEFSMYAFHEPTKYAIKL